MGDLPATVTEAAAGLRAGRFSSAELVRAALARADALDDRLGVYLSRFDDLALAAAQQADRDFGAGRDRSLLQGIPVGVKDVLAVAEGDTTAQSLVLDRAWGRGRDAVGVERLKAAGAAITGKLTTMEFAAGLPDPDKPFPLPRNPWNTEAWTGGSSSGAAAGVASGMMLAALGTDTGGSIRTPAMFCGISGLKPTFGRVPVAGCVPLAYSLDHVGPLACSARDCGALLDVLAGPDRRDPYSAEAPAPDCLSLAGRSVAGVRIGVERASHFGTIDDDDPAAEPAFERALEVLADAGANLTDVTLPHNGEVITAAVVTSLSEELAYHRNDLRERAGDFVATNRVLFSLGACFTGADYVQAQRVRRLAQRALQRLFADVDVIAMPAGTRVAPTYDELLASDTLTAFRGIHGLYWNAVGNPALVVPMGFNADGMPLSLQLAGRPFEEARLVQVADAYQRATDWHLRLPPVTAAATGDG